MYNAERMGTISVISSTPVMPMLVLSVIPESYCDHGLWEAPLRLRRSAVAQQTPDRRSALGLGGNPTIGSYRQKISD